MDSYIWQAPGKSCVQELSTLTEFKRLLASCAHKLPSSLNPKPDTLNPKPQTLNPNPKPYTLNPIRYHLQQGSLSRKPPWPGRDMLPEAIAALGSHGLEFRVFREMVGCLCGIKDYCVRPRSLRSRD